MANVAFKFSAKQAVLSLTVQSQTNLRNVSAIAFQGPGTKTVPLSAGTYDVGYRALGTPGTTYQLHVSSGGTMNAIDRTLASDGKGAGVRTLVVAMLMLGVLLTPAFARAQAAPESTLGADRRDARANLTVLPTVATPSSPGYSVSLDASSKDKKGKVTIVLGNAADTKTFTLTAFGPIDPNTEEATPVSLDGLASSAGAEFALNIFHWSGTQDVAGMKAFCKQKTGKDECDDDQFTGADRAQFLDLAAANETPWLITAKGSVGRTRFNYSPTRTPYAPQSVYQNDWNLGVNVGRYEPTFGYVAASYTFQRAWTPAGGTRQVCSPIETTGSLECRSFIVGAPNKNDQQIVDVQWRKFFPGGKVALNPIIGRDLKEKITFVRVPVYLFSDENGGLAGGARFEWRSDTRQPTFVVFVGAALKVLG